MNLAKAELRKLRAQMERFVNLNPGQLKPEELKRALQFFEIQDVTVDGIIEGLQAAEAESAKLFGANFGESHPRWVALKEREETLSKQLADQLNTIRSSRETKAQLMEGVAADLGDKLKLAKSDQIKGKHKSNNYNEAKMRYLQNKRTLEAVQKRYSTSLFERGIDFDPAKIWEKAEPAAEPLRLSFRRFSHAFAQ